MRMIAVFVVIVVCVVGTSVPAFAAGIPGLYNTGVDDNGTVRSSDFSNELHYTMINPVGDSEAPTVGSRAGWAWHDLGMANWIAPEQAMTGWYTFVLDFDLTGYDPDTASFTAEWLRDNTGYVLLNGNEITGSRFLGGFDGNGNPLEQYGFYTDNKNTFTSSSGFNPGANTLEFKVWNGGGPVGVNVAFLESNVVVTPEPMSMALFGLGGAAMTFARRRMKA